jgi:hypothetical protein
MIRAFVGVLPTIVSPILPFVISPQKTTFNPDDPHSEYVYYFMSYEWFRSVGLDILMIFVNKIISGIIMKYFQPIKFLKITFHILLNRRTASEHSLFTLMPDELPVEGRIIDIITMAIICAITGCISPIVFLFFSFYVLVFISIETNSESGYKGLPYLNPELFIKLAQALQFCFFLYVTCGACSIIRVFYELNSSAVMIWWVVGIYIFVLFLFIVSVTSKHTFFKKNDFYARNRERCPFLLFPMLFFFLEK